MKTSKSSLLIQLLLTIPIVLFLFIYNYEHSLLYSSISIALLLILGYSFFKKNSFFNIPTLLLLVASFLFYAFGHLGSKVSPQTYKTYNYPNMTSSFTFQQPKVIDEVCYYFLIDRNAKFVLKTKENEKWNKLDEYNSSTPPSFQWTCHSIKPHKVKEIELTTKKGQMMLSEIRFRHHNQDINFTSTASKLNDETLIPVTKGYYNNMIFDEIYHGRTAYELKRDIYPVYETVHPYLGKLLLIPGIELFGMTPFGWRFDNVIFGAILLIVTYLFSLQLFRKPIYGFIGAFLMTYSFMHLTEARIALIDTIGVLFIFSSYLFLYQFIIKQKLSWLLLSGLFFGLASAVKWSALFAGLGFIFIALYLLITKYPLEKRFQGYKLILYGLLSYGLIALVTYILTFYDLYKHTGTFQSIIDYQVNLYKYHSTLVATHPYSSPWWSWPFDIKPLCASRVIDEGRFSSVTIFGNPAIFWMGVVAMVYLGYIAIKRRTLEAVFILFAFLSLYAPYIFIGRIMFIYHYYYAVPFLILSIVYGAKDFLTYYPKQSIFLWVYLAIVAGLFLLFYPVLSGYEVPKTYVDNVLIWFPGWWL